MVQPRRRCRNGNIRYEHTTFHALIESIIFAVPRYIVQAGEIEIRTPGGRTREELWIGIETDAPVNLEFLSRCGFDLIPAQGMTEDELRSVGVDRFEVLVSEV